MRKQIPELLSPAGSWEALVATVQNGADAVYMGGTKFNARRLADNFDNEGLRKAVEYAHLYGVRVYITVNILIKERELEELKSFLPELEQYRVDGVIVQDLGAARYIAQHHPSLSLHASTQMTIHQLEGVQVLEEMGFDRVVPARECTLEELKHMSDNSSLELETFIHGALCVSYSGQCLMSSLLGGRSGNRGMCAQPCRLAYTLDKKTDQDALSAYHISMKDLSTLDFLDEILAAGVTSLKIEGRMKRAEYVAVVTRAYRKALDSILKTGHYKPDQAAMRELEQIFNRGGFTRGYYYGTDHSDLYAKDKPNHWGIYLGKVRKVEKGLIWIALEEDIEPGDGIELWTDKPGNRGQIVDRLLISGRPADRGRKGQLAAIPSSIRPEKGTRVYRTSRAAQLKTAQESFQNQYRRKIPVSAHAVIRIGSCPVLSFRDENGTEGLAVGDYEVQAAVKRALDEHTIQEQLGRLGDTPFEIKSLKLDWDDQVFLPVSVLNQLRRDAADDLMQKRIAYYDKRAVSMKKPVFHGRENPEPLEAVPALQSRLSRETMLNGYADRLDYQPGDLKGLDILSFAPASFSFELNSLREQVEAIQQSGIQVRLVLPAITRMADMTWLRSLPDAFWTLFDDYQIGNLGQLKLLKEKGIDKCFGSHTLNAANTLTMAQLSDLGLKGVTLSPELTTMEIRDIMNQTSLSWEILVYGLLVLMTLEYCPQSDTQSATRLDGKGSCHSCSFMGTHTLTDRKGYTFPVRKKRISRCYSELLNSQPVFLADNMQPLHRLSAPYWGLLLEGLSPGECRSVIQCYRYALDHPGSSLPEDLAAYAQAVKEKGFTKGHFFRGVE